MNYKHISTGEVISEADYSRLPLHQRSKFRYTSDRITKPSLGESSDIIHDFGASQIFGNMISDNSNTGNNNSMDFGGGDFSDGGASDDW